jgi:hypothetical protein
MPLFAPDRLQQALQLQRDSYELLLWANQQVKARRITLSQLHGNLNTHQAARSWIERNLASLPAGLRPAPDQVEQFAHLFASYLVTSFEPGVASNPNACGCSFCGYLAVGPRLKARTPGEQDYELARKLKINALEQLALAIELPLFASELEVFLGEHPELDRDVALVAWTLEILRRGEFRGQGVPVLALWREVAWKDGRPDKKFEATADRILAAEARIAAALEPKK